ncbi:MAG TPA: M55 family metallopeptidase [Firmicutes bacterium]|nr:M55 family metallopeptidase [Candidatus Fermentithermobacillaceae bacterium]
MKVFISCDIEGISGIVNTDQTSPEGKDYSRARELMTGEANAVIEGAVRAGATEIVVNDAHGPMRNLLIEKLHPAATLITGSPKPLSMMEGIGPQFQAAIFVGYHSRMGTPGVLSHTISGAVVANIWVNGVLVGETGINAGIAGFYGVPVVLVAGDDVVAEEARALLPHVHTVVVKQAITRYSAKCLPPEKVSQLLMTATEEALRDLSSAKSWVPASPVTFKIEFKDSGLAEQAARFPYAKVIDPRTLSFTADDYITAFKGMRAMIALARND